MPQTIELPNPLYADPEAYDIAFGWDARAETLGLLAAAEELAGRPLPRALEAGCGAGRVLRELARAGRQAIGLDIDPRLLRFAKRRLAELGLTAELVAGDCRDFKLEAPVDFAINPINGFGYLLSAADVERHLRTMAANLSPHGVYVIETSFAPIEKEFIGQGEPWAFERNQTRVMADWRLLRVDEDSGVVTNEATLFIERPGQPDRRVVCEQVMRKWNQPAFYRFIADSPLRLARMLWRDLTPLDPETPLTYADDNVFVLLQHK